MDLEKIKINNAIIHVLNTDSNKLILSKKQSNYSSDFEDFLKLQLITIFEGDDSRNCIFREDSEVRDILKRDIDFISKSQLLANKLFKLMQNYRKIPAADLIVLDFTYNEFQWLALMKLNYISTYSHNEKETNIVTKKDSAFPKSSTTHLKEAVIVNLDNFELRVKERKYEVDGIRANYFSGYFLRCSAGMSEKEKLNTINKSLDQVRKKYIENDIEIINHSLESRNAITEQYENSGLIDTRQLAYEVFNNNEEARKEFIEKLEKHHINDSKIFIKNNKTVERVRKQKIVTDSGITIVVPATRRNVNNISFINDGRSNTTIHIKNVGNLKVY